MLHDSVNGGKKIANGIVLGAAWYLAVSCPCEVYLSCYKTHYLVLLAIAGAFAFSK